MSSFFINDAATTQIYTLSLHDALPIFHDNEGLRPMEAEESVRHYEIPEEGIEGSVGPDRKSTRLNSSHGYISYAVFCLKKKINKRERRPYHPRSSAPGRTRTRVGVAEW